jgi:hypothetical protein
MDEAQNKRLMAMVESKAKELSEVFDTVHIFCQTHQGGDDGGTLRFSTGEGNWFARYGQIRHWLITEEESTRCHARKLNEE